MRTFNRNSAVFFIIMWLALGIFVTSSSEAAASTYYVAQNGSDGNSCAAARNINTPKRNVMGTNGGIACMQTPGDTLLIRGGIYPEIISNHTEPYSLPSGTDWNNSFTVAAYPGEAVVIERIAIATSDHLQLAYWIFDGLHVVNNVPGGGEAIWMRSPDHLRFVNMEVTTGGRDGAMCVQGEGNFIEFINVEVHSCGDPLAPTNAYGFYWGGSDTLFNQVKLHDTTGYGFHIYRSGCESEDTCPERITISNSEIYNTGTATPSAGILFAFGDGNQAHGNIIRNNSSGISVGYGASDAKIYNNKIYQNDYNGISSGSGWGDSYSSNIIIENNIIASNGGYGILNSSQGVPHGEPIGTIIQNNTMFNNGLGIDGILDTGIGTRSSNNITADVGL